ncbi:hypothetical protein KK141_19145 [Dyella sp. LX-66]|uniref:hypothetical protein n=1 Tax=unclassified Dyella TaxID=2634549 RepID=UPI001BE1253D|nr:MULTISPECIES: hypothetical protein [unclassified Dyella]MBT2119301.1 hypothetical protein [Dyella sp. LX-1]MBT2141672.1 hypothetical protein [Dyella sp. LX-66]
MNLQSKLRLSITSALWGAVFSTLRAVVCFIHAEDSILIVFYVDGAISEDDEESLDVAVTEVLADFTSDVDTSHEIRRVDYPSRMDFDDGVLVYLRKEAA